MTFHSSNLVLLVLIIRFVRNEMLMHQSITFYKLDTKGEDE